MRAGRPPQSGAISGTADAGAVHHNFDSAVAPAAARMRLAAGDRTLIEMGSRRIHDDAAIDAARAAYIGGFDFTSNLAAGERWGVPTTGTAAHAFTLSHPTERAAGAPGPGGVRIDSGDLRVEVPRARALLDQLGARDTAVVISGDLDEWTIAELSDLPVGTYGVGSKAVTGSGHPSAGSVYKLVGIGGEDGTPHRVAKRSSGKPSVGGRKWARRRTRGGVAVAEELTWRPDPEGARSLLSLVWDDGPAGTPGGLVDARERCARSLAEVGAAIPTVGEAAAPTPVAEEVPR